MSIRRSFSFHFASNLDSVITFYSPSCLGQEAAKRPFGFRVKLPPAHLSITQGGGFTVLFLMLNVKQESCEHQLLGSALRFDPPGLGNQTELFGFSSRSSI